VQIRLSGVVTEVPLAPLAHWFDDKSPSHYQLRVAGVPHAVAKLLVEYLQKGFEQEKTWVKTAIPYDLLVDTMIWATTLKLDRLATAVASHTETLFLQRTPETFLRELGGSLHDTKPMANPASKPASDAPDAAASPKE